MMSFDTRVELAVNDLPPIDESASPHSGLRVRDLRVQYGSTVVLSSVSVDVETGHTLVVLGESGCGKTTLLKAVAGLIPVAGGEIELENRSIAALPPRDRGVVYLDQEPLLFEHLTVAENIGFAMRIRGCPAREIGPAVDELLEAIELRGYGSRREWQLSGGQKQRVAFARAVLARPRLMLLDEPFGSLDSRTRGQMQTLFANLCRRFALTALFVTHDVKEALMVGDRFAWMDAGTLRLFPDRQAFINDRETGIPAEIEFWRRSAEPG